MRAFRALLQVRKARLALFCHASTPAMLTTAWVCRSCLSRAARPLIRRQLRHQSSSMFCIVLSTNGVLILAVAASDSIPPALLARARNIAVEHKTLTEKLADGFDTKSAKKLGEYGPIVSALEKWDKANEVRGMSDMCGLRSLIWAKVCYRTRCDDPRLENRPRTTRVSSG